MSIAYRQYDEMDMTNGARWVLSAARQVSLFIYVFWQNVKALCHVNALNCARRFYRDVLLYVVSWLGVKAATAMTSTTPSTPITTLARISCAPFSVFSTLCHFVCLHGAHTSVSAYFPRTKFSTLFVTVCCGGGAKVRVCLYASYFTRSPMAYVESSQLNITPSIHSSTAISS